MKLMVQPRYRKRAERIMGSLPDIPHSVRGEVVQRISFLERMKETTKADLLMKFDNGDWHGVQDCGSDLRDIDSELVGLRWTA